MQQSRGHLSHSCMLVPQFTCVCSRADLCRRLSERLKLRQHKAAMTTNHPSKGFLSGQAVNPAVHDTGLVERLVAPGVTGCNSPASWQWALSVHLHYSCTCTTIKQLFNEGISHPRHMRLLMAHFQRGHADSVAQHATNPHAATNLSGRAISTLPIGCTSMTEKESS